MPLPLLSLIGVVGHGLYEIDTPHSAPQLDEELQFSDFVDDKFLEDCLGSHLRCVFEVALANKLEEACDTVIVDGPYQICAVVVVIAQVVQLLVHEAGARALQHRHAPTGAANLLGSMPRSQL